MSRDIIVVDIETTGLHRAAVPLDVAAINLTTGAEFSFVPYVSREHLAEAEPTALKVNRYYERGVFERMLDPAASGSAYWTLKEWLKGNTLAGSNPTFDDARLPRWVAEERHHRLLDLSAYAAGVLGTPPNELEGLHTVCERLGVVNEDPHSALGDARATAECFRRLAASITSGPRVFSSLTKVPEGVVVVDKDGDRWKHAGGEVFVNWYDEDYGDWEHSHPNSETRDVYAPFTEVS
ncbi:3'-5' exonuclease [Mycolicibacterium sp. S2-37]|uniref:3'-5' exonuclease n=1 Tax=Mycolicibacterium sp. S2-37 TaxID=2810297 RepID=UPI001A93DA7C|nr:3'-5' exonuclease [Mycolicibacterium sp. S2-37]MBO0676859.1 3'-5' exonuclease [Mycolicibacterium sp. S2-37]